MKQSAALYSSIR